MKFVAVALGAVAANAAFDLDKFGDLDLKFGDVFANKDAGDKGTKFEVDLCKMSPCLNGGVCSTVDKEIVCECAEPFTGGRCEAVIDPALLCPADTFALPASPTDVVSGVRRCIYAVTGSVNYDESVAACAGAVEGGTPIVTDILEIKSIANQLAVSEGIIATDSIGFPDGYWVFAEATGVDTSGFNGGQIRAAAFTFSDGTPWTGFSDSAGLDFGLWWNSNDPQNNDVDTRLQIGFNRQASGYNNQAPASIAAGSICQVKIPYVFG
uniref:EGF-like domain-containing protein n=1 Tax=Chromera velia CCMP2878 TaxID=1169474 RepID=A0A0G4HWC3_9ALVE|mmetsp:Transcript_36047/g.70952  ORF Transcript_36047/g.70952 Transcript_36047/m.70952 type:complete len:267 (+) Transcript_36047:112-912(+)|eukprot:Cvel_9011.t1-p1 / transcript=Cvel_9011.t1 / gene=Cvel_9011 / organism=Chromera_velia_CCMP2878 / gene_product=hypothetical protein / transcript_product=hypothetical protein / location=Cvel_scaffold510:11872-12902(+) / protein_length=266 / sequence_SO=supercontig / SO=protein_coding / is_pseudo=false